MGTMPVSVGDLLEDFGGEAQNCGPETNIKGFASLATAGPGDLCFFSNAKMRGELRDTKAGVVALAERNAKLRPGARIVVADPHCWFAKVINAYGARKPPPPGVDADARVDPGAVLGADVHIGSGARIGAGVRIGDRSQVRANAVVADGCAIGADCILHEGCVIGAEGFGFFPEQGGFTRIHHQGGVAIGDRVEIGANSCVDRGVMDDTRIGAGTKIDNLVQIGHNVVIGEDCIICGKVGIGGSAVIGAGSMIGGKVGIADHIKIASGVQVKGGSMVSSDLNSEGKHGGVMPVLPHGEQTVLLRRLLKLVRGGG